VPATAIETLSNLQRQSLDALKDVQAAQYTALTSLRELAAQAPALPTVAGWNELVELNASFLRKVFEQQSAYATQLVNLFTLTK
jgi:hypothetical protein